MTTHTKINLASLTATAIMTLNVFSRPLGIPQGIQSLISAVVLIPLWLIFIYAKELKKEKAAMLASGQLSASTIASDHEKTKKRLVYIWIGTVAFTFTSVFWMPALSGINLGPRANVIIAFISAGMISLIFGIRLLKDFRRDPNAPPKWRILYIASIACVFVAAICASMVPSAKALVLIYDTNGLDKVNHGDFDGAILDFNRALKLYPNNSTLYQNRGHAEAEKGDSDAAIADYDKAIELDPNNSIAYYNRGLTKYYRGDEDDAVADWNSAIDHDPKFAQAYYNRSTVEAKKGDTATANADLAFARQLDPAIGK